jgi:glycerate 2-kinase
VRVLVAPQEFKGTLTGREAAEAIVRGLRSSLPDVQIDSVSLADGGPGTVEALVEATGGRYIEADAHDPLGRPVRARWGTLGGDRQGTAIIEMAAASGLVLLAPDERDPRVTSTFGTGELISDALDHGCPEIVLGVGGSATNDAGAGMAQALAARLLDAAGQHLPPGGAALAELDRIDVSQLDPRLRSSTFTVATDVTNPLCGPAGASLVYGPQKGATPQVAEELDRALDHFARTVERDLGIDVRDVPGAGAAGGLGAGLIAFCSATVRSGFDVVAEAVDLERRIVESDVVITGEGRLDSQTSFGKTAAGVSRLARGAGRPVALVAGQVLDSPAQGTFDATFELAAIAPSLDDAMKQAGELLESLSATRVAAWVAGRDS